MTMSEPRIRWEPGAGTNILGYAGTHDGWLFQIFKVNDDADDRTPILMCQFPGTAADCYRRSEDRDELKRAAEDRLTGFAASLGAIFPAATGHEVGHITDLDGRKVTIGTDRGTVTVDSPFRVDSEGFEALSQLLIAASHEAASSDEPEANPALAGEE